MKKLYQCHPICICDIRQAVADAGEQRGMTSRDVTDTTKLEAMDNETLAIVVTVPLVP